MNESFTGLKLETGEISFSKNAIIVNKSRGTGVLIES